MVKRIVQDAVAPYFGKIVLALICMALMAAATGGYAYLMDPVINEVFVKKNPAMLVPVGMAVLGFCRERLCELRAIRFDELCWRSNFSRYSEQAL